MSATRTLTPAQQAAAELEFRSVPKSERGSRPSVITPDVWKLGGAALRDLAGDLASGITTHVEARRAEREAAKASKPAPAPKAPVSSPPARVRNDATGAERAVVTQAQACKLAADLLKSHGYPVPRALSTLAKGRNLTPKA